MADESFLHDKGRTGRFVRVGTLGQPDASRPDIHIFTASSQPWVFRAGGATAVPGHDERSVLWPQKSLDRIDAMKTAPRGS